MHPDNGRFPGSAQRRGGGEATAPDHEPNEFAPLHATTLEPEPGPCEHDSRSRSTAPGNAASQYLVASYVPPGSSPEHQQRSVLCPLYLTLAVAVCTGEQRRQKVKSNFFALFRFRTNSDRIGSSIGRSPFHRAWHHPGSYPPSSQRDGTFRLNLRRRRDRPQVHIRRAGKQLECVASPQKQ
jgi:hypothetical protein